MRLAVESMAYGPAAIAHAEGGKTVFVEGAVVGDVVEAELTGEGKRFDRARALEIVEPSPLRVDSPCPYQGVCSGCPWGALAYPAQLEAKRANVEAALVRTAGLDAERVAALLADVVAPGEPWGYRNKVELAVADDGNRLRVGFHGRDDAIVAVDACRLLPKRFSKLPKKVAGALGYLGRGRDLGVRRVGIRASERTGDVEVGLWTTPAKFPRGMAAKVIREGTEATGVVRVMTKGPDRARKLAGFEVLGGRPRWRERLDGHPMAVSAPSFFQVNTAGAERLIELVVGAMDDLALDQQATPDALEAWDLYCGAGTFTLPLARRLALVEAVESYGPAVRDLRANLERAALDNVETIGGDAAREMPEGPTDLIVCDPPRAGLSEDASSQLSDVEAERLVYISCDPQTLARDVRRLEDGGRWHLASVIPVDLFPQTYHVENVSVFERA